MARQRKLLFSVSDRIGGHDVTPKTVPLGLLKSFVKEVIEFVGGTDKSIDPNKLLMSVEEGSLQLESYEELPADLPIWSDISQLAKGTLDGVDSKRASVAEKWRLQALKHPNRTFKIADASLNTVVAINADTYFTQERVSHWVLVERYLSAFVGEWGGMTSANMHLRLEDGTTLKVDTTFEQISEYELNPVYHKVIVRVELEEDMVTGERRNARFLGFADYHPRIDEDEYRRATEAGQSAWKDVGDAAEWVRGIRGGKE